MKEKMMQELLGVIDALNNVETKGVANLANLAGSIQILNNVVAALNTAEVTPHKSEE